MAIRFGALVYSGTLGRIIGGLHLIGRTFTSAGESCQATTRWLAGRRVFTVAYTTRKPSVASFVLYAPQVSNHPSLACFRRDIVLQLRVLV